MVVIARYLLRCEALVSSAPQNNDGENVNEQAAMKKVPRRRYSANSARAQRRKIKRASQIATVHDAAMNFTKNIGMLLLAIFLIVYGLTTTFAIATPIVLLGILALVAGIFILIGR